MLMLHSLQGPKSEDDVADGAEAEELSGYEPESDINTVTVHRHYTLVQSACVRYSRDENYR